MPISTKPSISTKPCLIICTVHSSEQVYNGVNHFVYHSLKCDLSLEQLMILSINVKYLLQLSIYKRFIALILYKKRSSSVSYLFQVKIKVIEDKNYNLFYDYNLFFFFLNYNLLIFYNIMIIIKICFFPGNNSFLKNISHTLNFLSINIICSLLLYLILL